MNYLDIERTKNKIEEVEGLLLAIDQAIFCGGFDVKSYEWAFNHLLDYVGDIKNELYQHIETERKKRIGENGRY